MIGASPKGASADHLTFSTWRGGGISLTKDLDIVYATRMGSYIRVVIKNKGAGKTKACWLGGNGKYGLVGFKQVPPIPANGYAVVYIQARNGNFNDGCKNNVFLRVDYFNQVVETNEGNNAWIVPGIPC